MDYDQYEEMMTEALLDSPLKSEMEEEESAEIDYRRTEMQAIIRSYSKSLNIINHNFTKEFFN
jgi:hypothetical protein